MEYVDVFIKQALESGVSALFFHIEQVEKGRIGVYEGAVETALVSKETLIFVEGNYKGNLGYTYTCDLNTENIPGLIENMKQTAIENGDPFIENPMPKVQPRPCGNGSLEGLANRLLQAEKGAAANSQVKDLMLGCGYTKKVMTLQNEKGDTAEDGFLYYDFRVRVVAGDGTKIQTASAQEVLNDISGFDVAGWCKKTAEEAVDMLMAAPCISGEYPVVLRNDVFSEIFCEYMPVFFGDNINKGMSLLAGKLETAVASEKFTLTENPGTDGGVITRQFDDEGTVVGKKAIIENGVLKTYLHSKGTAGKAGASPTGNGYKPLYHEKASVSFTNAVIEPGAAPLSDMVAGIEKGVLITSCDGIFAGANVFSGDFSLISKGFMIENGKITAPVNQITIGGNIFSLLKDIQCLSSECAGFLKESTYVKAPSVLAPSLLVSGI